MKRYKNLSGDAGVTAYDTKANSIDVQFNGQATYTYDKSGVGARNLSTMQQRAKAGKGLSTLIATNPIVREGFTRRRGAK
jgi:hypothetical protein